MLLQFSIALWYKGHTHVILNDQRLLLVKYVVLTDVCISLPKHISFLNDIIPWF